jgi:hypothetical protein
MDRNKQPIGLFIGSQYLKNINSISSSELALTLKNAGYFSAPISSKGTWVEQNAWIKKFVRLIDYSWLSNNFWFTYERDAIFYSLKWS